jgi:hypothetical protein
VYRRVAAGAAGSASAFGDLDRALITLTELRARSADRVAARGREVAAARTQLASAVRRRSALERHRDRCRLAHDALLELRENADIDEANRARTART